jgi:hypothetical protein
MTRRNFALTALTVLFPALSIVGCKSDIWADQSAETISSYKVPSSAKTVAFGTDSVSYTAREKGIVYLVDRDDQGTVTSKNGDKKQFPRVLDKALVLKDQTYSFDSATGNAGLAGFDRTPIHLQSTPGHHYEIRFDTKELKPQ